MRPLPAGRTEEAPVVCAGVLPLPIDCVSVTAHWEASSGFRVSFTHRHEGGNWSTCPPEHYDHLALAELVQVIEDVTRGLRGF